MKYRRRPVIVDAVQWFRQGDHPAVRELIDDTGSTGFGTIATLEGRHLVSPGDWIITGVKGEHYACRPEIFAATYEPVEEV